MASRTFLLLEYSCTQMNEVQLSNYWTLSYKSLVIATNVIYWDRPLSMSVINENIIFMKLIKYFKSYLLRIERREIIISNNIFRRIKRPLD